MAQHAKIAEFFLKDSMPIQKRNMFYDNKYIRNAIDSIYKRVKYYERYIPDTKVEHYNFVMGKQFNRLPAEYAEGNYIPFFVGSYIVGKKIVYGGKANFELHYNSEHCIVYLVA